VPGLDELREEEAECRPGERCRILEFEIWKFDKRKTLSFW